MARAPGLSVRLKLTLSYVGFLMLAGALLLGVVVLESGQHGVEAVGEFAKLVLGAFQLDPVGERPVPGLAGCFGDAGERGEHAAGEDPPSQQAEHQQEQHHHCR